NEDIQASLTEINQTITDLESSTAESINNLEAKVDGDISSAISSVDQALATHEQANATQFAQISASLEANEASITEWSEAFTSYQESTATQIESITASIEGQSVSIEENKTAITSLESDMSATWSVKIAADSNGMKYFSGISLGLTGSGTSTQSQCIFLVDRFVLMTAANGTYTTPFYVTNGAMYVREAFIKDASIATAKIADAAITTAKIASQIQSTNYVSGSAGWMINKSGSAEFNNVTVRGAVYASSGKFKGTVEATAFVGDVASMSVIPESSFPNQSGTASRSVTKTYKDSSSSSLSKTVYVMIPYYLAYYTYSQSGRINITININGNSKTISIERGASTPQRSDVAVHCVSGITAQTVTVTVTESYTNTSTGALRRPGLVLVTRSSGTWS
ncbi:TPA: DUF1983 domain-containing protein, partial [Escherichia coli]|nr:DUF1983 domain-containing protein [Escherichia coli]